MTVEKDYANFNGHRVEINYINYGNPKTFAQHIWYAARDSLTRRCHGMDIYTLAEEQKYLAMYGPAVGEDTEVIDWTFKFVELKMNEGEGMLLKSLQSLSRVPEKFVAPVFFLDREVLEAPVEGLQNLSSTMFGPTDLRHYVLSENGVNVQTAIRTHLHHLLQKHTPSTKRLTTSVPTK